MKENTLRVLLILLKSKVKKYWLQFKNVPKKILGNTLQVLSRFSMVVGLKCCSVYSRMGAAIAEQARIKL